MFCPSCLAGVKGSLYASPAVCHSLFVYHCGGGCHHAPMTASRARYKHVAVELLPACCLAAGPLGPAIQTWDSDSSVQRWPRLPGPPPLPEQKSPRQPLSRAPDFCSHTSLPGNPLSRRCRLRAGWLPGKQGPPGAELSRAWLCPPADSTRCLSPT